MRTLLRSITLSMLLFALPLQAAETTQTAARTVVLVRHGHYVADANADEKIGPGLSPLGVAQAHLLGARLAAMPGQFDARHVSPMQRARDTAAGIAAANSAPAFTLDEELAECTPPTRRSDIMQADTPESFGACKQKLDRVFARYFRAAEGSERSELLVCHGNVIRYLVTRALQVDSEAWLQMSVGHASITRIRIEADGSFKVIAVGDVGHLTPNLWTGASGDVERSLAVPSLPLH